MWRLMLVIMLALFLQSCELANFDGQSPLPGQPSASAGPEVSSSLTPSGAPTKTTTMAPRLPTPSFTPTPTYIYLGPTATPSGTPTPTGTIRSIIATQVASLPPIQVPLTSQSPAFENIVLSGNQIFWGTCQPAMVKVSAHVPNAAVSSVLIFTRLQDLVSSSATDWSGGADMTSDGKRNFTYTLTPKVISRYKDFRSAWVQYQMVAYDKKREVGRTQLFLNNITIAPCR